MAVQCPILKQHCITAHFNNDLHNPRRYSKWLCSKWSPTRPDHWAGDGILATTDAPFREKKQQQMLFWRDNDGFFWKSSLSQMNGNARDEEHAQVNQSDKKNKNNV